MSHKPTHWSNNPNPFEIREESNSDTGIPQDYNPYTAYYPSIGQPQRVESGFTPSTPPPPYNPDFTVASSQVQSSINHNAYIIAQGTPVWNPEIRPISSGPQGPPNVSYPFNPVEPPPYPTNPLAPPNGQGTVALGHPPLVTQNYSQYPQAPTSYQQQYPTAQLQSQREYSPQTQVPYVPTQYATSHQTYYSPGHTSGSSSAVKGNHTGNTSSDTDSDDKSKTKSKSGKSKSSKPTSHGHSSHKGKKHISTRGHMAQSVSSKQNPTLALVKSFQILEGFGSFDRVDKHDPTYSLLSKYVHNSFNVKTARIEIYDILKHTKWFDITFFAGQTPSEMLLWSKTTPNNVKRMLNQHDGCVAFYDRVARALAVKPEKLEKPMRQVVLLCAVKLGKMHTHRSGYKTWESRTLPSGCQSVKGCGRLIPDSRKSKTDGNGTIIVPCGKTVEDRTYKSYELEYNEYMVYEHKKFKVRYAIDVEVFPGGRK